ncbi:AAA family ATPase [Candidatus Marsarchaeota archaeon]|nr:AAA family ATPase [Candidatus Marsarchaeota archaeon]
MKDYAAETTKPNAPAIEITGNFGLALDLLENTGKNLFITGKAGTGKSTLLQHFRSTNSKNIAILAPTGVSAVNIKGQTIHSFFGFRPDITIDTVKRLPARKAEMYRNIDAIIIDEISMVRADLLDCIDTFLRYNGRNPGLHFGGIRMVFIGDLYQLPPIVPSAEKRMFKQNYRSEYFFDARAFEGFQAEFIELDKYYRHRDARFIELLNSIRNNTAGPDQIRALNERCDSNFDAGVSDGFITLVPTNRLADEINNSSLMRLNGKKYTYDASSEGSFSAGSLPADEELNVKAGAQVMLLNNDRAGRWVNGSVGHITSINSTGRGDDTINVRLLDGSEVEVERHAWELFKFLYDPGTHKLMPEVTGRFVQYPLMLAWAVTIHKSQGKTFDKVIVDVGSGIFANGQLYVALSRCRTLEGIILRKRIEKKHIFTDYRVVRFLTRYQYAKSEEKMPLGEKVALINGAIKCKRRLEIVYLKSNDEKSRRIVMPSKIGNFEYLGRKYLGMAGFDSMRNDYRNFRVERILEIKETN